MVLTGAFSTGALLRVPVSEYEERQRQLGTVLNEPTSPADETTWNPEGVRWLEQPSYDEGGGGYSNLVPLVLIQREGTKLEKLLGNRERAGGTRTAQLAGWVWEIEAAYVQLFDLGVGVIVGIYRFEPPRGLAPGQVATTIREWCDLTRDEKGQVGPALGAAYEETTRETAARFRAAVKSERCFGGLPEPEFPATLTSSAARERSGEEGESREAGRLKWLHPVFVLPPGAPRYRREPAAKQFEAIQSGEVPFGSDGGVFLPGVKRSVIQLGAPEERPDGEDGEDGDRPKILKELQKPSAPLGLITLNWAYYAAFMDFDRGLLATLDEIHENEDGSLRSLERDARRTYFKYVTVAEARARLDSALNGLGPGQMAQWEEIARVTRFDHLLKTVERKLEVLETVAESRVQRAAAESSKRNRFVLTTLTVLTVFTLAFAAIAHFAGDKTDSAGHSTARFLAFVAAGVLAAAGLVFAEMELTRRLRSWRERGR